MIVTFYSYKGGTGRSMALANVGWILATHGKRVLIVDWDLEAPGLHRYLHPFLLDKDLVASQGVIDLMWDFVSAAMDPTGSKAPGWHEMFAHISPYAVSVDFNFPGDGTLDLVPAGRQDGAYASQVSTFDWSGFYDHLGGGAFLESLKQDIRAHYDYVLIDSRTGVSDTSGICTVQMPDVLVNCFTANTQSIEGAAAVARSIRRQRPEGNLRILPVPMRVEAGEQDKLEAARDYWQLLHKDYVSDIADSVSYWATVEVPYTPYYAYEEILAPIGDRPGQRRTVLAACESLVGYLTDGQIRTLVPISEFQRRQLQTRFHRAEQTSPSWAQHDGPTRVFISYEHSSPQHVEAVRRLWMLLRESGIDARLDHGADAPTNSATWLKDQLAAADFILVVGSPDLRNRSGALDAAESRTQAELAEEILRTSRGDLYGRVLPVLLPGGSLDGLPGYLGSLSDDCYVVEDFTVGGAEALLRILTNQPTEEPPLGQVPLLPPKPLSVLLPGAKPEIWNVPPRNPNFTGRNVELASLAEVLSVESSLTVSSLRGLGGVGKTQLVIEYANAHAMEYDVIWWVTAEEPAAIPDQFAALASRLGLDPETEPEALPAQVYYALRSVHRWLLVFDNADEAKDIIPWLPAGPLPAGIIGNVIVTTRRGGWASLGRVMDLDVITLADAVALLRSRVPDLGREVGEQIAEEHGRLPLALEQAAAYLDRSQMPPEEYLALLRSHAFDLYKRGQVANRSDTLTTLWDISLEHISNENPAAVQVLSVCAYLAPAPIPLDLFTDYPGKLPDPLSSMAEEALAFADTIAVLVDYSLAKRTPAGLQVHRLLQAAARARHNMLVDHPLAVALGLLRVNAPEEIINFPENWPRWAVLLPHVLAATNYLMRTAEQLDDTTLIDGSWLLDHAGTYLQVRARFTDAKILLERSLAITETAYGPDHPVMATRLNNLGLTLRALGQPDAARPLLERSLAITETAYGPDHPDVATRLNNLGLTMWDLGQLDAARSLLERSLAITETAYGPDHPVMATQLNNLGLILRDLGQPDAARPLLERALTITEMAYGPDHPVMATRLNNLGLTLRALGQPDAARPLLERALTITEMAYGPDHPDVATQLNNLALILRDLGQPDAARPLLERALAIIEAAYGPDHPVVATSLNNLVGTLEDLGQLDAARHLEERAPHMQSARSELPTGEGAR